MSNQSPKKTKKAGKSAAPKRDDFECIALLLQGGGALGSYQAGVYQGLAEKNLHPTWVAGISIGAINAAIIAGNAPEDRVQKLKDFWESITVNPMLDWATMSDYLTPQGIARQMFNQMSAGIALTVGAPGFFEPRNPSPFFQPEGTVQATSFYDTSKLKPTLEKYVDFDRINAKETHLSVGAVNVKSGNFVYFDNSTDKIGPEHIIASGSLPPGFPATEIDGEFYWDGGLISNTPLQWVVDSQMRQDTLAFQVDLWPAEGKLPRTMVDVTTRQKEIQYSSRTRAGTDSFKRSQRLRSLLATLLAELPGTLKNDDRFELLRKAANHKVYNIVHLIYRSRQYEGDSRDYEFSRLTMNEHWKAGHQDVERTLQCSEIFKHPQNQEGVAIFDMLKDQT
jgi:NTE family protein